MLEGINEENDESGNAPVENAPVPVKSVQDLLCDILWLSVIFRDKEAAQKAETTRPSDQEPKKPRIEPSMKHLPIIRSSSATRLSNDEAVERYYERNAHTVHGSRFGISDGWQVVFRPGQTSGLDQSDAAEEEEQRRNQHSEQSRSSRRAGGSGDTALWQIHVLVRIQQEENRSSAHLCGADGSLVHDPRRLHVLVYWESQRETSEGFWSLISYFSSDDNGARKQTRRAADIDSREHHGDRQRYKHNDYRIGDEDLYSGEWRRQAWDHKELKEAYVTLMKLEGQYKGSTYYKLESEDNWKWTFESAFFFSMNVYTTTGYGSIAPESTLGQLLVCVYGFIFVPVTLVALRDLGQFCLVQLTKLYAHLIQRFRWASAKWDR